MFQKLKCSLLKLLTQSAVLCSLAVPFVTPAYACSFDRQGESAEDFFKTAQTAFIAHVVKTEEKFIADSEKSKERNQYLEATFEVIEVLKGTPPESGTVHDLVPGIGNCSIGLIAGLDYLFMPDENTKDEKERMSEYGVAAYNYVGLPTGSKMLPSLEHKITIELLNRLRALANKPAHKQGTDK